MSDYIADLIARANAATAGNSASPPQPYEVPTVTSSELTLAARGLMRQQGMSETDAMRAVIGQPLDAFRSVIESQRAEEQAQLERQAKAEYNASPAGLRAAAAAAIERQEQEARDGRLARVSLIERGLVDDATAAELSNAEAISLAFTVPKPDTLAENLAGLSDADRAYAAQEGFSA